MTRRNALLGLLACITLLIAGPPAAAVENETFGMVPHPHNIENRERRTFAIPLEPGAVFEDAVRVYNRSDQALDLIAYAADAEAGVDGTISVGFRGSKPEGVGAWLDLSREEISLPPRGEALVHFRIEVRSGNPTPDLGAIVVENDQSGVAADLAERLQIVVRTTAPNSSTTSVRVRPLLVRSPWIIVATIGLLAALVIVWLGARRARRPKDAVVPTGGLERTEPQELADASKPVLRRLGEESRSPAGNGRRRGGGVAANRPPRPRTSGRTAQVPDGGPVLDDDLADVSDDTDVPEDELERTRRPARKPRKAKPAARRKPARSKAKKSSSPERFIPLDDL